MIKLKELISERRVSIAVYSNNKGNEARVMSNKDLGKFSNPKGFYVEVDFKYDKEFKDKRELDRWLKKNNYRHIGQDKAYM